jgi:hypothetical protein
MTKIADEKKDKKNKKNSLSQALRKNLARRKAKKNIVAASKI